MDHLKHVHWFDRIPFIQREAVLGLLAFVSALMAVLLIPYWVLMQQLSLGLGVVGFSLCSVVSYVSFKYCVYTICEKGKFEVNLQLKTSWRSWNNFPHWVYRHKDTVKTKINCLERQIEKEKLYSPVQASTSQRNLNQMIEVACRYGLYEFKLKR